MKRLNLNDTQDYLALFFRRKWWVLIPFFALSSAVTLIAFILPRTYVSETLTLIRARDVPVDIVRDLIAGTPEQRLGAVEQIVLGRTNLVRILNEFEEGLTDYQGLNMDEKVVKLRSQIKVTLQFEGRSGSLPLTYFRISYQNQNPELAQKIAGKLTSLFIEQDSRVREVQVFGTTEFLSGELEKVSKQLERSETKLKELKARRRYELPDQLETNLRTLDRLGLQKQSNAEALDRYATIRLNLERQISETPPVIPQPDPVGPDRFGPNPLIEQYLKKQIEFEQLSAKYTPRHPEVEAAKAALERLKAKIPPEDLALAEREAHPDTPTPTAPNPLYRSLVAQLQEVKIESAIREKEKEFIISEIEKYSERVQNAPQSEQEIAAILRENTDLTKQYDDLKNKLSQARLSESLESRQKGSQFVVVDPANLPLQPTKPDKWKIVLMGTIFSLIIGIALAIAVEALNQNIWKGSDIETLFGVPVLIEIPEIVTNSDLSLARRKKVTHAASGLAVAAAYVTCLYFIYTNQTAVLRQLDPLIQRFMY